MNEILVFLDCEFTDLLDIDLVSIGLVTEDGSEFYGERNDFRRQDANDFVQVAVLPQLGALPDRVFSRRELAARLRAWFEELGGTVSIVCSDVIDFHLLCDALDGDETDYCQPRKAPASIRLHDVTETQKVIATHTFRTTETAYHTADHPWHHAMHDAGGLRAGWMAFRNYYEGQQSAPLRRPQS